VTFVDSDPTSRHAPSTSPARQRILATADALFYSDGIRAVGVDRLIRESGVTKATFYKHFGAKEHLVIEYMTARHEAAKEELQRIIAGAAGPKEAIDAVVGAVTAEIQRSGFRGDPFLNAAAEYSSERHPVRTIVADHRDWYTDTLADLLRQLGHPLPGDGADEIVLAIDGATAGGYASDPVASAAAMQRAVQRILTEAGA
jgi:AcrR family transcriptional regulator